MAKFFRVEDVDGNSISMENLESISNRVDSISSESTENQYPSARAVYELVNGHDYSLDYFTFVILGSGMIKFIGSSDSSSSNVISYSLDNGETWSTPEQTVLVNVTKGDRVMWKGEMRIVTSMLPPIDFGGIGRFSAYVSFEVLGNIMSLLYGDNFQNQESLEISDLGSVFSGLFNESYVTKADNLILPATTLTWGCYRYMFRNCSHLTTPPQLPATILAQLCYDGMFGGCSNLTKAPELPATTLAERCYLYMFSACDSLTTAPELPATTLADYCYYEMFSGSYGLTTPPTQLPATTLATGCYNLMFNNCQFLTKAPELPATTLTENCYDSMFFGCSSLVETPTLPSAVLTESCYSSMFYYCRNLSYIKMLATDVSAQNCLWNWVNNVSATGIFIKSATSNISTGNSGIPEGWQVYTEEEYELVRLYQLSNKENTSNKVNSISSESTDDQYPSAKCVYDLIGNVENLLSEL